LAIELWGGVECTVNRVGDDYIDQLESTGHDRRLSDLDLFAAIGLSTLRYPVLWERVAPHGLSGADFSWTDQRLNRLRELGIEPIVGLVHHGSGPRDTSLLDPQFPDKLAEYARVVAARYPWVRRFTPINEPLTTARFSGLYGHWYPHHTRDASFARMLWNECRATSLAMRAIREITPDAELVQTEDGGHTFSTAPLQYQAEFENDRRWLAFDLLLGRVGRLHPLWSYLKGAGLQERDLEVMQREPCPPAILGLNYYVTSDRFLDHRAQRYPDRARGGNGRDVYADAEAVRVRREGIYGHAALLQEAHHRYGLPVAITEAHLGCSREEQVRWLLQAWNGAHAARAAGVDVRAVTAWALLGCTDWDSLVTRRAGHYEPGAFDVRAPSPRRTALGSAIRELTMASLPRNPALHAPGWWQRPSRLMVRPPPHDVKTMRRDEARPVLIAGATGTLGRALGRVSPAAARRDGHREQRVGGGRARAFPTVGGDQRRRLHARR
jgi:dTDP-4-dehydrorhamnose reductase